MIQMSNVKAITLSGQSVKKIQRQSDMAVLWEAGSQPGPTPTGDYIDFSTANIALTSWQDTEPYRRINITPYGGLATPANQHRELDVETSETGTNRLAVSVMETVSHILTGDVMFYQGTGTLCIPQATNYSPMVISIAVNEIIEETDVVSWDIIDSNHTLVIKINDVELGRIKIKDSLITDTNVHEYDLKSLLALDTSTSLNNFRQGIIGPTYPGVNISNKYVQVKVEANCAWANGATRGCVYLGRKFSNVTNPMRSRIVNLYNQDSQTSFWSDHTRACGNNVDVFPFLGCPTTSNRWKVNGTTISNANAVAMGANVFGEDPTDYLNLTFTTFKIRGFD